MELVSHKASKVVADSGYTVTNSGPNFFLKCLMFFARISLQMLDSSHSGAALFTLFKSLIFKDLPVKGLPVGPEISDRRERETELSLCK